MKAKIPFYNQRLQELKNGADFGYCRICDTERKLSVDHVPPQSCGNRHKLIVTVDHHTFISQNGLNCKTICEKCNNELLGSGFDKTFKILYDRLNSFKKSILRLPQDKLVLDINSADLLRCILGHFLAIGVSGKESIRKILEQPVGDEGYIFNSYRKFVLGETNVIPNTRIYYWYYPFYEVKIRPYFAMASDIRTIGGTVMFGTLIKIFPVAIFVANTKDSHAFPRTEEIDSDRGLWLDQLVFETENIVPKDWPERPDPNGYGLVLEDSGSTLEVKR